MNKIVLAMMAACSISVVQAQDSESTSTSWFKQNKVFQNLDVSVSAGTTGIGIDVASMIGDYVQLRAGYDYMPRYKTELLFPVEIGGQPAVVYDDNGTRIATTFDRLSKMLKDFTGFQVDEAITMLGHPTVNNFKFLVDVYPFKQNRHWHFTAGFYWGPSQFAYAENSTLSMTSLLAVNMYNQMYDKCVKDDPIISIEGDDSEENPGINIFLPEAYRQKIVNYGRMGFHAGYYKNDVYYTYPEDVYSEPDDDGEVELLHKAGETVLLHKAGDPYMVEPGADGMVTARAKAKSFKPYLGFGYGGRLLKNRDDWQVSFDAGAMFWGGTPDLYTHDGTNLTKDVTDVTGKVGDWVHFIGGLKFYPVINVRFTKTIF